MKFANSIGHKNTLGTNNGSNNSMLFACLFVCKWGRNLAFAAEFNKQAHLFVVVVVVLLVFKLFLTLLAKLILK